MASVTSTTIMKYVYAWIHMQHIPRVMKNIYIELHSHGMSGMSVDFSVSRILVYRSLGLSTFGLVEVPVYRLLSLSTFWFGGLKLIQWNLPLSLSGCCFCSLLCFGVCAVWYKIMFSSIPEAILSRLLKCLDTGPPVCFRYMACD